MTTLVVGVVLILLGVRALARLVEVDRVLAARCGPSTGVPVWDEFYETQEIPPPVEVWP